MDAESCIGSRGVNGTITVAVRVLLLKFEAMLLEAGCPQIEANHVLGVLESTLTRKPDDGSTCGNTCESVGPYPICAERRMKNLEAVKKYRAGRKLQSL